MKVSNLRISFRIAGKESVPVRDVSFDVPENSRVALVGESGCGKSLSALAIGKLIDRAKIEGEISGVPRLAYIFQNPMLSLNPTMKIGAQIIEAMPRTLKRGEKAKRLEELLSSVALPTDAAKKYPCRLSGGQQQRAMIAIALAREARLLIADEPTTALDVTTQRDVLDLIERIADERKMSVLFITHNLALVARYSRYVYVMYAGKIVESGEVKKVLSSPRHPYTKGLIAAVPSIDAPKDAPLEGIPGTVPQPTAWPTGCAFHPRCPVCRPSCSSPDFVSCPEMQE